MHHHRSARCLFVIFLILISNGCSLLTQHTKMVIPETREVNQKVVDIEDEQPLAPKSKTVQGPVYKVDNTNNYHLKREAEGKLPSVELIPKTRYNILGVANAVTVWTSLIAGMIGIGMIANEVDGGIPLAVVGITIYIASALDALNMPTSLHPKIYEPEPLYDKPQRAPDERYLYINKVMISDDANLTVYPYKHFLKYNKGKHNSIQETELEGVHLNIRGSLHRLLIEADFQDTTQVLFSGNWNTYYLESEIKHITAHEVRSEYADGFVKMEAEIEWRLLDYLSKEEVAKKTFTSTSPFFMLSGDDNSERLREVFDETLKRSLSTFVHMDEIKPLLKSSDEDRKARMDGWEFLQFPVSAKPAATVQDAIKATVTIVKGKGHGSGFFISKDGYLITNYHVTGSEEELEIILNNGDKTTAKLVRSNPRYDLSLMKVDDPGKLDIKPLQLDESVPGNLGSDVFAVGTPKDINLGQTLTKGIISGKRTVDEVEFLQYDAKVNPGNSGGPLITQNGHLIGVVNAKMSGPYVEGIGFAIPAGIIPEALKVTFAP